MNQQRIGALPRSAHADKENDSMGCFISELMIQGESGCLSGAYCKSCGNRNECPYVCGQTLHHAACQGTAAAQLLTKEAGRLLETVSNAGDAEHLLDGDGALERALTQVLCSEMNLINEICVRSAKRGP